MLKKISNLLPLAGKIVSVVSVYKNFPLWFLDRLHILPRKKILYRLRNGISFTCESNTLDCQFINEMFVDYQYTCLPEFKISSTDTVVDCGSHKGIFTIFAARQAFQGKVISYEASPQTYQYLTENLSINGINNVTHFNSAVGLLNGTAQFCVATDPGCSMVFTSPNDLQAQNVESVSVIEVPQTSFDSIASSLEQIDFLKMDIEGMEFPILMKSSISSLAKVKRLAMEYHPEAGDVSTLIEHLKSIGFQTHLWPQRRILYAWRDLTRTKV
jgi:FkbM family methyltransferase